MLFGAKGAAVLMAGLIGALSSLPAGALPPEDIHSENIRQIARAPIAIGDGREADGSDLAFQGDLLVAGSYSGTAFFKILRKAPFVRQVGLHSCPGGQGDVSIYKHLVFVSLDSPQSSETVGCADATGSAGKEGIRVLDVTDPSKPRQVAFIEVDCGSHTHTINPQGNHVFIYNESYPLGAQTESCSVATHRKVPIVKVPVDSPGRWKVVNELDVSPEIGCHDVTILDEKEIAAAACIGETQLWDMADPATPRIISRIVNPSIEIHHGAGFTWDGNVLAIADEFAGSVTGSCAGSDKSPVGALWFYDVTDPSLPVLQGYFNVPRYVPPETPDEASYLACTSHNFNILPMKAKGRYVAAVGYRNAGFSIVDFSDPSAPTELAHYLQIEDGMIPDVWSAYWYNGRVYSNDNGAARGVSVYEVKGLDTRRVRSFADRMNPQVQVSKFK